MIKYIFCAFLTAAVIPVFVSPSGQDYTDVNKISAHIERDLAEIEYRVDSLLRARQWQRIDSTVYFNLESIINQDNATDTITDLSAESNDR